jgi:hypothetical protein
VAIDALRLHEIERQTGSETRQGDHTVVREAKVREAKVREAKVMLKCEECEYTWDEDVDDDRDKPPPFPNGDGSMNDPLSNWWDCCPYCKCPLVDENEEVGEY